MAGLPDGLYESILDEDLRDILKDRPELRSVFGKIEADEEPSRDAQLVHELLQEMPSADGVDILVSFIKWSGLRLLMPGLEELSGRSVPVRVITTSYMGASDAEAIEWLASLPNVTVRISYDTDRTRLHAKAYHFHRRTGFSTAYRS